MVDQLEKEQLREAIELFYFAYRSFTAGPDRILREQDLGRVHHRILYFVGRHPHININELLRILDVSKQALNAPLRKLLELGLVEAETATHDRRVKQLVLSKQGQKLEARLTSTQMEHLAKVFEKSGVRAVKAWREVMRKIPNMG